VSTFHLCTSFRIALIINEAEAKINSKKYKKKIISINQSSVPFTSPLSITSLSRIVVAVQQDEQLNRLEGHPSAVVCEER
jgi:hypothetical protein